MGKGRKKRPKADARMQVSKPNPNRYEHANRGRDEFHEVDNLPPLHTTTEPLMPKHSAKIITSGAEIQSELTRVGSASNKNHIAIASKADLSGAIVALHIDANWWDIAEGSDSNRKEPKCTETQDTAAELVPVVADIADVPKASGPAHDRQVVASRTHVCRKKEDSVRQKEIAYPWGRRVQSNLNNRTWRSGQSKIGSQKNNCLRSADEETATENSVVQSELQGRKSFRRVSERNLAPKSKSNPNQLSKTTPPQVALKQDLLKIFDGVSKVCESNGKKNNEKHVLVDRANKNSSSKIMSDLQDKPPQTSKAGCSSSRPGTKMWTRRNTEFIAKHGESLRRHRIDEKQTFGRQLSGAKYIHSHRERSIEKTPTASDTSRAAYADCGLHAGATFYNNNERIALPNKKQEKTGSSKLFVDASGDAPLCLSIGNTPAETDWQCSADSSGEIEREASIENPASTHKFCPCPAQPTPRRKNHKSMTPVESRQQRQGLVIIQRSTFGEMSLNLGIIKDRS